MMLYLAADKILPLLPWENDYEQYLCVNELDESNKEVKKQFTKRYYYYLGSYKGCGCGFRYPNLDNLNSVGAEHHRKSLRSVQDLFAYINDNIRPGEEVELYSCWAGNEGDAKREDLDLTINLNGFEPGKEFGFEEDQYIIVKKD